MSCSEGPQHVGVSGVQDHRRHASSGNSMHGSDIRVSSSQLFSLSARERLLSVRPVGSAPCVEWQRQARFRHQGDLIPVLLSISSWTVAFCPWILHCIQVYLSLLSSIPRISYWIVSMFTSSSLVVQLHSSNQLVTISWTISCGKLLLVPRSDSQGLAGCR
jgi:hypothetical protein